MKKLLVVLIALILCSYVACAETLEINQEDLKLDLSESHTIELKLADQSAFAVSGADKVTREGTNYIVENERGKMTLDMARYPGILCFTQDKFASFDSYLYIDAASIDTMVAQLIEDGIDFYLVDVETGLQVFIYSHEGDDASIIIGNLAELSEANLQVVTTRLFPGTTILKAGSTPWIKASDSAMVTIANNHYVVAEFGGSGDQAGDQADTLDILSYMTIE